MAVEYGGNCVTFQASAAVTQFYVVELASTGKVAVTNGNTDFPVGSAQEAASADGDYISVQIDGVAKCVAGGAIDPGAQVMPDTDGQVVAWSGANYKFGIYIGTSAAASGDVIPVLITHAGTVS